MLIWVNKQINSFLAPEDFSAAIWSFLLLLSPEMAISRRSRILILSQTQITFVACITKRFRLMMKPIEKKVVCVFGNDLFWGTK